MASAHVALASESTGSILAGFNLTKVCESIDCSSYGNVNWKPTLNANTTGAVPVVVTDTSVTGWLWGDAIGWVNLQPTGAGVTVNPNTGALSGYAWSNTGSWINFSPTTVPGGTAVGVTIDSQGQFVGWAYVSGLNGGWMKFDCSSSSTCIKTDWRPIPNRTVSSPNTSNSSTGSGSSFSSGGSTPEQQAADLAAIWAYNNIQTIPSSTPPQISPTDIGNGNLPAGKSAGLEQNQSIGGQPYNSITNTNAHDRNQNASSTAVHQNGSSWPTSMSDFLNATSKYPIIILGFIFFGVLMLLVWKLF